MRAVGLTCGIGSMLVGARQAGFEVIGNIEWRSYYHAKDKEGHNTFTANFPGAFFKKRIDQLFEEEFARVKGIELALGHPECGAYSTMNGANAQRSKNYAERKLDPGDIPLFCDLVSKIKPRFFAMDDLPKSLDAFPMEAYHKALPDYDLYPEWISNYGYGNIQKYRKRMFMIGALKTEGFSFIASEFEHHVTVADTIGDLPVEPRRGGNIANHDPHALDVECGRGLHLRHLWDRPTWREMRDYYETLPMRKALQYHSPNGGVKTKPGWSKTWWDGFAPVMDGGSGAIHPFRNLPLTIRERARIQGFPDDFIFYGTKLNEQGEWDHVQNITMVKQTGKAMPIQFNRFFSEDIRLFIEGKRPDREPTRMLPPNPDIDKAKQWYCAEVGYSNQEAACKACWLYKRCRLPRRVGPLPVEEIHTVEKRERTPVRPRADRPRPQPETSGNPSTVSGAGPTTAGARPSRVSSGETARVAPNFKKEVSNL